MIRYQTTLTELQAAIRAVDGRWLRKAKGRTTKLINAGEYDERSSIWSDIKTAYMDLQHNKCAYCERLLAGKDFGGTIEHDVEHYRPKGTVPEWPHQAARDERGLSYSFPTGDSLDNGYFWLAYHPLNYCTTCKKCNSPLKSNFFPIASSRGARDVSDNDPNARRETVSDLTASEKPFLIYPLGDLDEDPEELITFVGITAIPVKRNGPRWRRARVTIDFFELNRRSELRRERARKLVDLGNALFKLGSSDATPEEKKDAEEDIRQLVDVTSEHASCVRSACRLYQRNPAKARELFREARRYLRSLRSDDSDAA